GGWRGRDMPAGRPGLGGLVGGKRVALVAGLLLRSNEKRSGSGRRGVQQELFCRGSCWGSTMGYRPPKGVRPPQLEGKRTGRPKKAKAAPLAEEAEPLAQAMRHVLATPADRTHEQREVRRWLERDRRGFLRHLAKLEAAELARPRPLTREGVDGLAAALAARLAAAVVRCLEKHAAKREGPGEVLAGPPERGDREGPSGERGFVLVGGVVTPAGPPPRGGDRPPVSGAGQPRPSGAPPEDFLEP